MTSSASTSPSGNAPPSRAEQIARVAHEALRTWREVSGGEPLSPWPATSEAAEHSVALVRAALSGGSVEDVHALRAEAKLAAPWAEAPEAARQESALFRAVARSLGCGQERWDVKTGTDALAAQVAMNPISATIPFLTSFAPPPADPLRRVSGSVEFQVWTIEATVTSWKEEQDSDYHLALADDQGRTMIAEAVCPGCASDSLWLPQIQAVRSAIEAALGQAGPEYADVGRRATITGVGLFDRLHGQRGCAPNGVELHPILAIDFGGTS